MMLRRYRQIIMILMVVAMVFTSIPVYSMAGQSITESQPTVESSSGLTDKQTNSINMLNYLTVLTQEINESKNSRLFLDQAYSNLLNNTEPTSVDKTTQSYMTDLLDILANYKMIDVKRERLHYIYEQNQAKAIRAAVPNPLGLLSAVKSFNLVKLASSIVYMAVDSKTSYDSAMAEASMKFLQDGWELDDAEEKNLHESRKKAFLYKLEIVRNNNLPKGSSLTEKQVEDFVGWKNTDNVVSRIRSLESHKETYKILGEYWLVLARSYFENKQYKECLDAVGYYEGMHFSILMQDHDLANVLPLAISAAGEVYTGIEYENKAVHYLEMMKQQVSDDEWALRYFMAQSYVDLYGRTNNKSYLDAAYNITVDNVNTLKREQQDRNKAYLNEIVEEKIPDTATKDQKKEIKEYNKMLKEERKVELAPIYEPLLLNCDLLFGIAKELKLTEKEKENIGRMMRKEGETLFLNDSLEQFYQFKSEDKKTDVKAEIDGNGSELILPASALSSQSTIECSVTTGSNTTAIDDWIVEKVSRKKGAAFSSFTVHLKSKAAKKYKYNETSTMVIKIVPSGDSSCDPIVLNFKVSKYSKKAFIESVKFQQVD